jgi:GxxExxY protein
MIRENVVAREIVAAAHRVHETLGPGLLESVYEAALAYELASANLPLRRQHPIPVRYNDVLLATGFRADLLVDACVLVEIKSVHQFAPVHFRQLETYLRLSDLKLGLLLNFGEWRMKRGIKRILNGLYDTAEPIEKPAA